MATRTERTLAIVADGPLAEILAESGLATILRNTHLTKPGCQSTPGLEGWIKVGDDPYAVRVGIVGNTINLTDQ